MRDGRATTAEYESQRGRVIHGPGAWLAVRVRMPRGSSAVGRRNRLWDCGKFREDLDKVVDKMGGGGELLDSGSLAC